MKNPKKAILHTVVSPCEKHGSTFSTTCPNCEIDKLSQEHAEMLELLREVVAQAKSQQEEQRLIMISADKFLVDASDLIDRIDKGE